MINDPITKVMQDASEIVRYDEVGIPLYIREGLLSSYPDHRALCHWHEDIEWVQIRSGQMNNVEKEIDEIKDIEQKG